MSDSFYHHLVQNRRHIHQNPEISYHEFETTAFINERLEKLGYILYHPLKTGVVAELKPTKDFDKVIAFRADIDALPMDEEGEAKQDFISKNKGAAHCCGHDMHTTILLGFAEKLAARRDEFDKGIVLIFQPGEEKLPGGGRLIMESGLLQSLRVQQIFGLHTSPQYPVGTVASKIGAVMARPDEFILTVKGVGGHAASPHLAVDPIVIASQIVTNAQSIVSRAINPIEPSVITFGSIHGGSAHNVIPEQVELKGTIRTFSEKTAMHIVKKLESLAKGISQSFGGDAYLQFDPGYPAVTNAQSTTELFFDIVNDKNDISLEMMKEPIMAGEDFAFYQQEIPGTFFFLGTYSKEADSGYSWHHPKYNTDEKAMPIGVDLFLEIARRA